jgi:hypothetical protein
LKLDCFVIEIEYYIDIFWRCVYDFHLRERFQRVRSFEVKAAPVVS